MMLLYLLEGVDLSQLEVVYAVRGDASERDRDRWRHERAHNSVCDRVTTLGHGNVLRHPRCCCCCCCCLSRWS